MLLVYLNFKPTKMKKILLFLTLCFTIPCLSQDVNGDWYGALNVYGSVLPLEMHIDGNKKDLTGTLDSPSQKSFGMELSELSVKKKMLHFKVAAVNVEYTGIITTDGIEGTFTQNGLDFKLNFTKEKPIPVVATRTQTPAKPYPYTVENVSFKNKEANITLAGTLTLPKEGNNFPVVVLISGSGAQDRDETMLDHKPFLVLSDYLTRKGIAVLRYDDRGTAESGGDFDGATSYDFANDANAAVEYLMSRSEINKDKIGLIGHSEGGMIAPLVATLNDNVDFLVLMAGVGVRGDKLLIKQQELLLASAGQKPKDIETLASINRGAYDIVIATETLDDQKEQLTTYFSEKFEGYPISLVPNGIDKEGFAELQVASVSNVWMREFMRFTPNIYLEKVKCPVLILNGTKDLQVDATQNVTAIEKALTTGGNTTFTTHKFENLNHLFQECKTGDPSEYGKIEQTIAPVVLSTIQTWISSL